MTGVQTCALPIYELENAKAKLKGQFIMSLEKPETIAEFALSEKLENLPEGFYNNYLKSIDKVTIADTENAAKANILPNQSRIFIAGKASEIADSVEKLGYPVKYFDAYANPTQKPATKKIDANVTVESIAQKFISATGSKAALEKVKYLTTNASGTVQGMALELSTIKGKKGEFLMEMKMMGNTVQKIVFNGKDGYIVAQGNKIPMPEEAKTEMKAEAGLFPEANFTKDKVELKGIETINGEDAYTLKQGSTTYYYSVKSGLKLGELKLQKANGQEMSIPTYYSDYKEVQGLKLP